MNTPAIVKTSSSLTIIDDSGVYAATKEHPCWADIIKALADGDYETAKELFDPAKKQEKAVAALTFDDDRLTFEDGHFLFNGVKQGEAASAYLKSMVDDKMDLRPTINFLEKLDNNTSYRSRQQALEFVVRNEMPITEDGNFLAYKRITDKWQDVYSQTLDNSVGSTVEMPRKDVDDDPNHTCSVGLHVCSVRYLKSYSGARLIAVCVDPANVVAVPTDYNGAKMRVSSYLVVKELPLDMIHGGKNYWSSKVVDEDHEDKESERVADDAMVYVILGEGGYNAREIVTDDDLIGTPGCFPLSAYAEALANKEERTDMWLAQQHESFDDNEYALVSRVA